MPKKVIIAVAPCDQDYLKLTVVAQYNPKDISFTKSVSWDSSGGKGQDFPMVQFTQGDAIKLTLELLFDSYDDHGGETIDVREQITKLMSFVHVIDKIDTPRPPMVQLFWGTNEPLFDGKPFTGVVSDVDTHYTMFNEEGRAVRATAKVTIVQAEKVVEGDGSGGDGSEPKYTSAAAASNCPDDAAYEDAEKNNRDLTSPGDYSSDK